MGFITMARMVAVTDRIFVIMDTECAKLIFLSTGHFYKLILVDINTRKNWGKAGKIIPRQSLENQP